MPEGDVAVGFIQGVVMPKGTAKKGLSLRCVCVLCQFFESVGFTNLFGLRYSGYVWSLSLRFRR